MLFENFLKEVERGRRGLNAGLPHGFVKLAQYIPNVQRSTYYLIGGSTGCGKSALAIQMFIYEPFNYILNNETDYDISIHLFSFEIDKNRIIAKLAARQLYEKYGLLVDINTILSKGKFRISQEVYDKVLETRRYFERLEDKINIIDTPENPTMIYKYLLNYFKSNGRIITKIIERQGEKREVFDRYEPFNENLYTILVVDHVSLLAVERGFNTKQLIDKLDNYIIYFRNKFYLTAVVIQQLSYDIFDTNRVRTNRLFPVLSDFGDSKYTTRSADFVISLFSPHTFDIRNYLGYRVDILKDKFRVLEILKGRDGGLGYKTGLEFVGEVGIFKELPLSREMTEQDYYRIIADRYNPTLF